MTKVKIKNQTEARMDRAEEVFGSRDEYVEYSASETQIELPNGIVAEYTKTIKDLEGYEVLKDIVIEVDVEDKQFTLNWTQDSNVSWIVQAIVNKLIAVKRTSNGSGLSREQREILKDERARYNAGKKSKK
jgi:hypothetical protein